MILDALTWPVLIMMIICIGIAPIFSGEYQSKCDSSNIVYEIWEKQVGFRKNYCGVAIHYLCILGNYVDLFCGISWPSLGQMVQIYQFN